jgi:hypothetical protein
MDYSKEILKKLTTLSEAQQREILQFIETYSQKNFEYQSIEQEWNNFSFNQAMIELKNDLDLYTLEDIKNK